MKSSRDNNQNSNVTGNSSYSDWLSSAYKTTQEIVSAAATDFIATNPTFIPSIINIISEVIPTNALNLSALIGDQATPTSPNQAPELQDMLDKLPTFKQSHIIRRNRQDIENIIDNNSSELNAPERLIYHAIYTLIIKTELYKTENPQILNEIKELDKNNRDAFIQLAFKIFLNDLILNANNEHTIQDNQLSTPHIDLIQHLRSIKLISDSKDLKQLTTELLENLTTAINNVKQNNFISEAIGYVEQRLKEIEPRIQKPDSTKKLIIEDPVRKAEIEKLKCRLKEIDAEKKKLEQSELENKLNYLKEKLVKEEAAREAERHFKEKEAIEAEIRMKRAPEFDLNSVDSASAPLPSSQKQLSIYDQLHAIIYSYDYWAKNIKGHAKDTNKNKAPTGIVSMRLTLLAAKTENQGITDLAKIAEKRQSFFTNASFFSCLNLRDPATESFYATVIAISKTTNEVTQQKLLNAWKYDHEHKPDSSLQSASPTL